MHTVCNDWNESVRRVSQSEEHYLILIHLCSRSPLDWATTPLNELRKDTKDTLHLVRSRLHGRMRTDYRRNLSLKCKLREDMREAGKHGAVIRSLMDSHPEPFSMLTLPTPEGILTQPFEIHGRITREFDQWHSLPDHFSNGLSGPNLDPTRLSEPTSLRL